MTRPFTLAFLLLLATCAGAPAIQASELGAEGVEAGLQNGGGGALGRQRMAQRLGRHERKRARERGEQRGAPVVELDEVVEALVGDELGLLGGQRLEGGPGAHTTAADLT